MVKVEESSQPFGLDYLAAIDSHAVIGERNDIAYSLVVSFGMIMGDVLANHIAKGPLAE
jgi:hypothetical protein